MKQLTNYCSVLNYEQEIEVYPAGITGYCKDNGLDGVELYLYDWEAVKEAYKLATVGVHLKYWPSWMDFWHNNNARLERLFPDKNSLRIFLGGADTKEQWLEVIRRNIESALLYEPEYLVWHVSECDYENIYTWNFTYNSNQVLQSTVEVFREVAECIPDNVQVLFENLWWPGLRLTDPLSTGRFFDSIYKSGHENVGIMLDTGHLMNTNPMLRTEAEGIQYVINVGKNLGSLKKLVQGFHLSCSLSGEYQKRIISQTRANKDWHFTTDGLATMQHITSIDQHKPFREASLSPLVEFYEPRYINHELYYDDMHQLAELLKVQCSKL